MASESKIRVLFTIPNFDTAGSGKALLNIATRLDRNIFEPQIGCLHTKGELFREVENSGIPVHVFQFTTNMKNKVTGLINCWKISRLFMEINPHIVHSFHYGDDYSEALSVRLAGKKYVYTKKNMNWGSTTWKVRSFFANAIITINKQAVDLFFKDYKKPVRIIYRGIDTLEYAPDLKPALSRADLGVEHAGKVVATVANIVPLKGIDYLITAFSAVHLKHPEAVLVIVGHDDTDYGLSLKKLAGEKGISHKIIFTGKKLNVKDYLQVCDIFVFPTTKEAFGVALTEAMAMEKYVLGSDTGGVSEQLSSFPELLFRPRDVEQLTAKLDHALSMDPEQLRSYGRRLRQEAQKRFSIHVEVKEHEKLYLELAGKV